MNFEPAEQPFPRWWGPYSPARGNTRGFRLSGGQLGVWVDDDDGRDFWVIRPSEGSRRLQQTISQHFGGGRILLLPDGSVIKPLQQDVERGQRVFLGEIAGAVVLQRPDGTQFSMMNPGQLNPGDRWPGPSTTGLECVLDNAGNLRCDWKHPADYGEDQQSHVMVANDLSLRRGFRAARPGAGGGRVRVTAHGHVITNREVRGEWQCLYVGRIEVALWPYLEEWIEWEE